MRVLLLSVLAVSGTTALSPAAFASSLDNTLQLTQYVAPVRGSGNPNGFSSTWGLSVDDTSTGHKQTIDGFGAAVCSQISMPTSRLALFVPSDFTLLGD